MIAPDLADVVPRQARPDHRRPRLHRLQPRAARWSSWAATSSLIDSADPRVRRQPRTTSRGSRTGVRVNISDVRDEHSLRVPRAGPGLPLQPRRPDQPPRLDEGPVHRSGDQLPQPALDPRGLPAAQPGDPIVFASTRQIYGRPEYLPVDERHPLSPVDVNGINKTGGRVVPPALQERLRHPRHCVLRLTNTYGPAHARQGRAPDVPRLWFRLVLEGEEIQVWGDGEQLRDFNYVDDAVDAFLLAAAAGRGRRQDLQPRRRRDRDQPEGPRASSSSTANGSGSYQRRAVPARPQGDRHRRLLRQPRSHPRRARLGAEREARGGHRAFARLLHSEHGQAYG